MSKKKPIAKRLNKLFDDIKPEPGADSKPRRKKAPVQPPVEVTAAPEPKPLAKQRAQAAPVESVTQTDTALSLPFQMGQSSWATMQVFHETPERKWSDEDQLLVKQVTDQLSLALENARLFQEAQRSGRYRARNFSHIEFGSGAREDHAVYI
jgi:transcriptional regulator with GAF, ATPase, and Fis domain